jgi:hypothetical protein
VPKIEGLTVEDFLDHAKTKPLIMKYLPDEGDWEHLDKRWVCDVLMTLDTAGVQTMIEVAKQNRKEKIEKSQDLLVHMRPEFEEALKNTLNFKSKPFVFYLFFSS